LEEAKFFKKIWRSAKRTVRKAGRTISRGARSVARVTRRVGGRIVRIAKSTFNYVVRKARSIANTFKRLAHKLNVMRHVKNVVDGFFRVTESRPFKRFFYRVIGKIMRRYGFRRRHVKAAYKLLTRRFWNGQFWFFRWIVTFQYKRDFLTRHSYGVRHYKYASARCHDLRHTVDLGGKIMTKVPYPKVKAVGYKLMLGARLARIPCTVLKHIAKLKRVYNKIAGLLAKIGVRLPI
jgi:hypothetical protein